MSLRLIHVRRGSALGAAAALCLAAGCATQQDAVSPLLPPNGASHALSSATTTSAEYELVDVGAIVGSSIASTAHAVNASGRVLGIAGSLYFSWTGGNTVDYLQLPGGRAFYGDDVNDHGDLLGETQDASPELWVQPAGSVPQKLPVPASGTPEWIAGQRLNENGVVSGVYQMPGSTMMNAFVWSSAGGYQPIHSACNVVPFDLSSDATVVGSLWECGGPKSQVFRWSAAGGFENLHALGGLAASLTGINAAGMMAGSIAYSTGSRTAAVVSPGLSVTALPNPLGGTVAVAYDINDAGDVVGTASATGGRAQPVLWESDGTALMLPAFGISASAMRLSSNGFIVGFGTPASGPRHALLWRPVGAAALVAQIGAVIDAALASGSVNRGNAQALHASADAAADRLAAGQTTAAVGELRALVQKTDALEQAGRIAAADAALIRHKATRVIAQISG